MRLVQLKAEEVRRLAFVDEPSLPLIQSFDSVYALAQEAIRSGGRLPTLIEDHLTKDTLDYDAIYKGAVEWKLLPPIDPRRTWEIFGLGHGPDPPWQRTRSRCDA